MRTRFLLQVVAAASLVLCTCARRVSGFSDEELARPRIEAHADPAADTALAQAREKAQAGAPKQAAEDYLKVRRSFPQTTAGQEALYQAGLVYFQAGDFAKARQSFNELLFENPLFEKAADAKLKLGLSALEVGAYRDAYQTLSSLLERTQGDERRQLLESTSRAAEGAFMFAEATQLQLTAAQDAKAPEEQKRALDRVSDLIEGKVPFLDIAKIAQEVPPSHPAWPLITFKLARIYFHLRDWDRLKETLQAFLQYAPSHPFAAQAQQLLSRAQQTSQVRPRTVGVILPMTGRYQAFGEAVLRGIKLALSGTDLELVVKDSQGDPNVGGQAVEDLAMGSGAIGILGPLLADDSKRAALVAEELKVPLMTLTRSEGITEVGPHVFQSMLTNSAQAQALADYGVKVLGLKRWALLYPNIPYGEELANDFWDELLKRGGEVRGAETYAYDQTTFTAEAKKLVGRYYLEDRQDFVEGQKDVQESQLDPFRKHKALERLKSQLPSVVDFDGIFVPADWRQVGLIAPAIAVEDIITNACEAKDQEKIKKTTGKSDLRTVTLLGSNAWSSPKGRSGVPELLERGGKFVLCSTYVDAFFADSERPGTRRFVKAFQTAYPDLNRDPNMLEAAGYDAAGLFRAALERPRPQSREDFRAALASVKGFEGSAGRTSIDERRQAVKPLFFLTVKNDGVHEIDGTKPGT